MSRGTNYAVRLALVILAISQMAGCPEGNVGNGSSFSVVTNRVSVDSSLQEANFATGGPSIPSSGSSGYGLSTSTNTGSQRPAISQDGRFVAFISNSSNLVSGDSNATGDIFVRDRTLGTTERVSVATNGVQANAGCINPAISADGQFVFFQSTAANLGFASGSILHVYRRNRLTGVTEHVSNDGGTTVVSGSSMNGNCDGSAITPDGRYLVYYRAGSGGGFPRALFIRDMDTSTPASLAVPASPTVKGGGANIGEGPNPSISADARYVLYQDGGDAGQKAIIRMRDRTLSSTTQVSEKSGGGDPSTDSRDPVVSSDGQWVAFSSKATDILSSATSGRSQIYLRQMLPIAGTTTMISRTPSAGEANGDSYRPSISADGRYVVYESTSSDLVSGDTNEASDIFLWDRTTNTTFRLSVDSSGIQSVPLTFGSYWPVFSSDGSFVAFASDSTNLAGSDSNGVRDIFVRGPLR